LIAEASRADLRKPSDDAYADHVRRLLLQYIEERPQTPRAELMLAK
jgi:hypothetical protein